MRQGAIVALMFVAACAVDGAGSGVDAPESTDHASGLDAFIHGLGYLDLVDEQPATEVPCDENCPPSAQDGEAFCSYTKYVETAQFDRFVAFQPNSATLWPGAVVRGADAEAGLLTPVGVGRAPLTFSVSLENLAGSPVGHMEAPNLSSFRESLNGILAADVTGATPATLDYRIHEIYSESQLSIALGASVSWPGGNEIAAAFDFDSEEQHTRIVVDFTQAYYTVDVDTPERPSDFFSPDVTRDDLAVHVGESNPPVYVQSITYGRRVVFTVETSAERQQVEAALAAAYQGAVSADVDASVAHQQLLEEAKIHAFVFGGSASDATAVIDGFEGVISYIRRGGDYGKESPGAPIAYKLAYLDNAVTRMSFTTEYAERVCTKNRAQVSVELAKIDHLGGGDIGGDIELYGWVVVRAPIGGDSVTSCNQGGQVVALWSLTTGQWVSFDEFGEWVPTSTLSVTLEDVAVGPGEQLCLETHIFENDAEAFELSANDDYGADELLVSWDVGWNGTHVLQARGSGERAVDVYVRVAIDD
jgi:thiol-activated cytolysin